jgi:cytochrome c553
MKKIIFFSCIAVGLIANEGKQLYTKYGCYGCHGVEAKGTDIYPKLANLPTRYIQKRLFAFKKGQVNSNRANIMKPFAKPLTKKEIEKLADFLHSLKSENSDDGYYEEYDPGDSSSS